MSEFVSKAKLKKMQRIVQISTSSRNGLYDITREIEAIAPFIMSVLQIMKIIGTMIENSSYQVGFEHYIYSC
jgi:hypothetical protein